MVQMDNHLKHSAEKKQIVKRSGMLCSGHVNLHLTEQCFIAEDKIEGQMPQ